MKECLLTVIDIVCPEKRDLFSKISLCKTVTRRIEDLSSDIRTTLQNRAQHFEFYAIALDESTYSTDTAQVAIFVRGINATFDIIELASLLSLKDTTTCVNISQAIKSVIDILGLNLNNLCGITTDGAPAMVGKMNGAVSLIEKEMRNAGIERQLVRTHYIIQVESLCANPCRCRI